MSTTRINTSAVLSGNERLPAAVSAIDQARRTVQSVYDRLDRKVLGRNDLAGQLRNLENRLEKVCNQVQRIHITTENSVNSYYNTDKAIRSWMP